MRREADPRDPQRPGAPAALATLARGFLAHPDNAPLRAALAGGALSPREFFEQLLRLVFRSIALRLAETRGLPPRGGLFAADQCPDLATAALDDHFLERAQEQLDYLDYRGMPPEQLGRIYEDLLALVPVVTATTFTFAAGDMARGNARKTSGSYYTPDALIRPLLDSALDPLIDERLAENPDDPVGALLDLTIVDPACGAGVFLLAAARRLAARITQLRPVDNHHTLKQVITRCIHGVDRDPLAVELCKLALWLEVAEPGLPLSFLDAKIRRGDALFGATPALIERGIPDVAWQAIAGDDPRAANLLRRRNVQEAAPPPTPARGDLRLVADAWCAAFVWPKPAPDDPALAAAPTAALFRRIRDGEPPPALTAKLIEQLAARHDFFHWHLEFPAVCARGGFDLVLANPPWEKVKLLDREWFAQRAPEVATAASAAARKQLLATIRDARPDLHRDYLDHTRRAAACAHFLRNSGAYPLCGRGDINLYAVFAELIRDRLGPRGRGGCIVPTGIATDDTTKHFFSDLLARRAVVSLYDFENGKRLFPAVQGNVKFCLLTISTRPTSPFQVAAQLDDPAQLRDPARLYKMSDDDVRAVNPNTGNCPTFRLARDAALVTSIHRRLEVMLDERDTIINRWQVSFGRMFDMTNDSHHFRISDDPDASLLPLYEAKLAHQFNHRAATFAGIPAADRFRTHARTASATDRQLRDPAWIPRPRFWVPRDEVARRWPGATVVLGFRNAISATADSRSLVATLVPFAGLGNSLPYIHTARGPVAAAVLAALLNSFVLDHVLRQKASGGNLNFYILKQLPLPAPDVFERPAPWQPDIPLRSFIAARVLELSYHSHDLAPFARELGHDGPPFRWDRARRVVLRAELDAACFHVYGLSRADAEHVLDAFPIVRRLDEQAHGEHRTKRLVLAAFDAMTAAARAGSPYHPPTDLTL